MCEGILGRDFLQRKETQGQGGPWYFGTGVEEQKRN